MSPERFLSVARAALSADRVRFAVHAFERMGERDFDIEDALEILRTGIVAGMPVRGRYPDEWRALVYASPFLSPVRVGVAAALRDVDDTYVRVLTVQTERETP